MGKDVHRDLERLGIVEYLTKAERSGIPEYEDFHAKQGMDGLCSIYLNLSIVITHTDHSIYMIYKISGKN